MRLLRISNPISVSLAGEILLLFGVNVATAFFKRYTECLRLRLGVAISRVLRLRAACYWLSAWQQAGAVHHGTRTAAIVNVRRFVTKSSLFTCKWVG